MKSLVDQVSAASNSQSAGVAEVARLIGEMCAVNQPAAAHLVTLSANC